MSRIVSVAALLTAIAAPAMGADWGEGGDWAVEYGDMRGSYFNEPKDWSGLGDEDDSVGFEAGLRYWYSWGAHSMTAAGGSYSRNDITQIPEAYLRIDDYSSNVYAKGIAGYSAVINSDYSTPSWTGNSQSGRVHYFGGDIGYAPLGDRNFNLGGFAGYQYWNNSPDMGRENFLTVTGGGDSEPNDISYQMLRLGISGKADFGVFDVTAEVAAIPYALVNGTYGALTVMPPALSSLGSSGHIEGWLYGAAGEVMARFRPAENWVIGLGGRAWYLTGQADVTFDTREDATPENAIHWITKTTQFSDLRYGLLGEVSYKF